MTTVKIEANDIKNYELNLLALRSAFENKIIEDCTLEFLGFDGLDRHVIRAFHENGNEECYYYKSKKEYYQDFHNIWVQHCIEKSKTVQGMKRLTLQLFSKLTIKEFKSEMKKIYINEE